MHREVNLNNGLFTDSASIYRLKATIPTEFEFVGIQNISIPATIGSHLVLTGAGGNGILLPEKATNGQIIYIVNKTSGGINILNNTSVIYHTIAIDEIIAMMFVNDSNAVWRPICCGTAVPPPPPA